MTQLFSSLYNRYKSSLSSNELSLLIGLAKHTDEIPDSTITQMSGKLFVSKSTLYRLIRKLGFNSYLTFKYRVSDSLSSEPIAHLQPSNLLDLTISQLNKTYALNQNAIGKAAALFLNAEARYVYGTGWKQKQVPQFTIQVQHLSD